MSARLLAAVMLVVIALAAACAPEDDRGPGGAACQGLVAGDLVVTEIFADHAGAAGASGTDDGAEWIELYAAAGHSVDLAGVALVHSRLDGSREKRAVLAGGALEPGAYLVAGNVAPDVNDGEAPAHVDVGYGDALGDLSNTGGGRLTLMCGATLIDTVTYDEVRPGRSRQLDGAGAPDYTLNDDGARWCDAADSADEFAPANRGTPGAANPPCSIAAPRVCRDGAGTRAAMVPAAGDLQISEVMPNPAGADGVAEWIEVRARRDVDLAGLVVGRDPASSANRGPLKAPPGGASDACLHLAAGERAVLARSADPTANGGLLAPVALFDATLINTSGAVFVAAVDGAVVDAFAWAESRDGVSLQRDEACAGDACAAATCEATVEYAAGRRGTPGSANDCGKCLDGAGLRPLLPPAPGQLRIVEWLANPAGPMGQKGEYIELRASAPIDLNGIQLGRRMDDLESPLTPPRCLRLAAGARAIFTHDGGDLVAPGHFAFALVQTGGSIALSRGGVLLDKVEYASSTRGRASIVDDAGKTCAIADDERFSYNGTDRGTPGAANPACP